MCLQMIYNTAKDIFCYNCQHRVNVLAYIYMTVPETEIVTVFHMKRVEKLLICVMSCQITLDYSQE